MKADELRDAAARRAGDLAGTAQKAAYAAAGAPLVMGRRLAEYGGKVDCTMVPGLPGAEGDDCSMGSHIRMAVSDTQVAPDEAGAEVIRSDELQKWYCDEFYLFDLEPCVPRTIHLWFLLIQDDEEEWGYDFIPNPDAASPDEVWQHWYKFNDWPSWALMKDKVTFSIEYDLWLDDSNNADG